MTAPDPVVQHNKAQFMASMFEAFATAKQMPVSLRNQLALARSTCKHFLKPHMRMQRIAQQKIALDKDFEPNSYGVTMSVAKQMDPVKGSATLMAAMGKVEEAVKGQRQPSMQETVDVLQELSKTMQIPRAVLKPTLQAMATAGTLDVTEVDELAGKITANPFTADQMWDAAADRMDATRDGRAASYRKQGESPPTQQNVTRAGYFQVVDVPKDKQFATMVMTPALANAMACGPGRANFTHLDSCGHSAARNLIEDLTNILLVGTNVTEQDREKSMALTLKSIAQDPMAVSFRTIIDKSVSQPGPTQKSMAKPAPSAIAPKSAAPAAPADAGGGTNVMEIFDKLKQMGQGVNVPIAMLDAVFEQLVTGNAATAEEVDKAKGLLKTKADDKGEVSFEAIQEAFLSVFGSKLGAAPK